MARSRYEEAIRLYVETAGDEELKALVAQLGEIGDVAEAEGAAARKALEGINDAAAKLAKVDAFAKLKRDLVATEAELEQAQAGAQALFREFNTGDASNAGLVKLQKQARQAVGDLTSAAEQQRLAVQRARAELQAMGVDTRSLGTAQAGLRGQFAQARAALSGAVADLQRYRAQSKQTASQVQADNTETAKSYGVVEKATGGLRNALAGVAAFFGFREAIGGVVNLLKVAAAAEDARRSLGNLYGSQAEGNRAFKELEQIARSNGLAFNDTVDAARKLKAFGLDPLNGSLQALIDQNAAVGGSQQDLEGKVLALGQAWAKQKLQGEEILQLVERGVPVWDLLQKATGKNVTELQKLSEQGKLGRDVIAALYTEIGKANAGAAEAGLSSLSGLLAQARARWVEFQQAVGNAGLTEYFKRQISELLGSTTDLNALAKRVSDAIIGTVEALKRFAGQVAPVVSAIGNFTLELFKHAEALLFVAKVYAGLRIAQFAQQFAAAAVSAQAATAATTALGGAAGAAAGRVGLLGRAMALIPNVLRVSVATVGIEASISLLTSLNGIMEERQKQQVLEERAAIIQRDIQRELIASGQQLTSVYREYANVTVQGGAEVSRMTKAQAQDYMFALDQARNYYRGVAIEAKAAGDAQAQAAAVERFDALGVSIDAARQRLSELNAEADKGQKLRAYVDSAVENFDKLASKGQSVRDLVSGIFDGLDLSSKRGAEQAVQIIDQISIRGTVAADAIRDELRKALGEVADEDLPNLKAASETALGGSTAGAKDFADAVNAVNLTRLGVDLEFVRTGISSTARAAIDRFGAARAEIKRLGLDSVQAGRAMSQAFRGAIKDVANEAEIKALREKLQQAVTDGLIPTGEYNSALNDLNKKLRALRDEAAGVGSDMNRGAGEGEEALNAMAAAARKAAEDVGKVGEKGKQAGEETRDGMDQASQASKSFAVSLDGVSQKFIELARSRAVNFRQLGQEFFAQQKQLQDELAALEDQNKAYDDMARRRQELRDKFPLVSEDQVDRLLNVEKTLADNRKAAADKLAAEADAARKAAEEALAATREADAERARAGLQTVEVIRVEVVAARDTGLVSANGTVDPAAADRIARAVLGRIERSRTGSNRRNRTR